MNISKMSFALCAAVALLLLSGCFLGDRFGTGKAVSVRFLPTAGQSAVSLSVTGPEVQETLEITDTVLAPEGLTRDANRPTQDTNGLVAYYHCSPESPASCGVFLGGDRLNIVFRERHQQHPGPQVERLCVLLAEKLRAHFGDKKVLVE